VSFNPKGKAEIKKVSITRGTSDDANVKIDIHLKMEGQPASVGAAALGAESTEEVERAFFRDVSQDADRNQRFFGIDAIEANGKWEARHAVKFKTLRSMRVSRVGGISLRPRGRATFDVSFHVSIEQPQQGALESLAEKIGDLIEVEFEHDAELAMKPAEGGQVGAPPEKPSKRRTTTRLKPAKAAKKSPARGHSMGAKPARKKVPRKTASGTSVN
jgi:hypothetical protein